MIAILAAVGAAFFNAAAGYLQHGATKQVPVRRALHPRLLIDLGRNRRWLLGAGCDLTAFGLQVLALALAPLVLVQPILVSSLLIAVAIRAIRAGVRPRTSTMAGALLCCGGLSGFLLAAHPRSGEPDVIFDWRALVFAGVLGAALTLCLVAAWRTTGTNRAIALGIAAGMLYGVTAGLVKIVTDQYDQDIFAPLQSWTLYVLVIVGITGAQLNQSAFQAGGLAAPIAVITVLDPLTSIGIGLVWLDEQIAIDGIAPLLELGCLALMSAGIGLLARETPRAVSAPVRAS